MSLNLGGKTAIVTGAGSGIGRHTAQRFAKEGANLVIADIDEDGGRQTADNIVSEGGDATFVETDVSEPDDVVKMVDTAVDTYGGLEIAFNNAAIEGDWTSPLGQTDRSDWDRVIDVNLTGIWECMKQELQVMSESDGGAIVNTSSFAGQRAAGNSPYVASKHGIIGITRVAAREYADADIRVNAVLPGVIDTSMIDRAEEEAPEGVDAFIQRQPISRKGKPKEIANAVVWLSSEEASFITGNAYPVEGGYLST